MKKTNANLLLLNMLLSMALVTSNVLAGKIIPTGLHILGTDITVTGGIVCYALTFLITDVIGELWGKEEASRSVKFGFVAIVASSLLILLTGALPNISPEAQAAFQAVLGSNWVFTLASLCAYVCSQSWDVWAFHRIRRAWLKKHASAAWGKWLWNNGSTMTSQIWDTVIFVGVSFGLGCGWLFQPDTRRTLFAMMLGQYLVKLVIAACDTPFFYLLTRRSPVEKTQRFCA